MPRGIVQYVGDVPARPGGHLGEAPVQVVSALGHRVRVHRRGDERIDRDWQGLAGRERLRSRGEHELARKRLADAEARLRKHPQAIEAGVDPTALVEVINRTHAERVAAEEGLANLPETGAITDAAIHAMIDSLGDVDQVLGEAEPDRLSQLYEQLHLDLRYNPRENVVEATSSLRVVSAGVRGRSCALSTRVTLGVSSPPVYHFARRKP
jgi:hypothetical protein